MTAAQTSLWGPAPMLRDRYLEAPRPRRERRPFQQSAIEGVRAQLAANRSTLLVLPTGTGKTFTACEYVREHETGAVLWLAHREELIDQAIRDLSGGLEEYVAKEKADERMRAGDSRLVVASVQTLKGGRLDDFARRFTPQLIIVDEAHHAVAPSYGAIIDAFPDAKVFGLTATPDRADERAMGQRFDSVAFVYEIQDAIRDGFLCPIRVQRVLVDAIDLRAVRTVAGDLNQGDLDAVMALEEVLHGVVKPTIELAGNRRTIVFTTSVANAHRMAEIFNRYRPDSARAVDGGTDSDERRRTLSDHKSGRYQFLCNVGVLTEGYDDPAVSCVAMARPTKSRSLYAQCAGRGLRILAGKEDCLLLDFVGNSGTHSLASALDILGGKYDDEVVAKAREKVEREGGMMAADALDAAAAEIKAAKEREAAKRARVRGKVTYSTQAVRDPFAILHVKKPDDEYGERFGQTATQPQIALLLNAGVEVPDGLTKAQASNLITAIKARRTHDLATFKQLRTLARYGHTDINITFATASKLIDAIAQNSWRPLSQQQRSEVFDRVPGEDG
ncbi:MAG TPA: DEAD/DEAH box helicase family protein [Terrimesophilobacter sp.]|nr:DEAD/DEAH box helicase family protein [Terrimesophilobacter sp.]